MHSRFTTHPYTSISTHFSQKHLRELILFTVLSLQACSSGNDDDDPKEEPNPPVAVNDSYELASGIQQSVSSDKGVLNNDTGEGLIAELISQPSKTTAFELFSDGSFSYQSDVTEVTTDQFQYKALDSNGNSDLAIVSITLYPKPLVANDNYDFQANSPINISQNDGVLANDSSARPLEAEIVNEPSHASSFTLNKDGSFLYTGDSSTTDSFTYRVSDGLQLSDTATVTLSIRTTTVSPKADSYTIQSGSMLSRDTNSGVLHNDGGTPSELSISLVRAPQYATDFRLATDGSIAYRTITTHQTIDSFSYQLKQGDKTYQPTEVTINISQANGQAPDANEQCISTSYQKSYTGQLNTAGITNPVYKQLTTPKYGTLSLFDTANGSIEYTPGDVRGRDSFSYNVSNLAGTVSFDITHSLLVTPVRIMPAGDSITSGVVFYDGINHPIQSERISYRKVLRDKLHANGFSIDYTGTSSQRAGQNAGLNDADNNGYPGQTTQFIRDNIARWLTNTPSEIVLLHIGTNGTSRNAAYVNAALDRIDAHEKSHSPVNVMLATLVPKRNETANARVKNEFNKAIVSIVNTRKNNGDLIELVDQYKAVPVSDISVEPKITGLHPTTAGYTKMANEWYKRLLETGAISKCQ